MRVGWDRLRWLLFSSPEASDHAQCPVRNIYLFIHTREEADLTTPTALDLSNTVIHVIRNAFFFTELFDSH
jgi:hypothetical protein